MILAIDQGTTGTTCIVFGEDGRPAGRSYREFTQHFPRPGWVEHDAAEIWEVSRAVAGEALADAGVDAESLRAIGVTNQRETVVAWDRRSGEPLHRAIVWQDRRTAARCEELKAGGLEARVRERTGLVIDPYFSGTKMEWLLQNVDGLAAAAASGDAVLGTIDAWLAFKLTGRAVTDYSNASRTMLFDIAALRWDGDLCAELGVPVGALPEALPSAHVFGETEPAAFFGARVPLAGIAGDQ
jgi:glycerol kinase